jgi:hypothetical protein
MSHRTDRVRIVVLLKRKPTLSKEEFHKHWTESAWPTVFFHGRRKEELTQIRTGMRCISLTLSLPHSTQAHINDPVLQQITQMIPGAPTTDWDGMAIFEAESYAKIFELCSFDPRFQKRFLTVLLIAVSK